MKRALVVILILVTLAAVQAAPENDIATDIQESECYTCHQAGGDGVGPVLTDVFRMFMTQPPDLELGASTSLDFEIRNWWTAEMLGFEGYIDIGGAPALSFESNKPPVFGSKEGELPEYEPAAFYQDQERAKRLTFDVATGGTDFTLGLSPKDGEGADLILRLWRPDQNPDTDTPLEIDENGAGEPENFTTSADPIAGGRYTLEVAEIPDRLEPLPVFDAIGFDVEWKLSYKFKAGATVQNGGSLVVLDGQDDRDPQETPLSFQVNVVSDITEEQYIRVYLESVAYYDHPPQFRAVDEWLYWNDETYFLTPQPDGSIYVQRLTADGTSRVTEFVVGEQVIEVAPIDEAPDLTIEEEASIDTFSEAVGYIAAFLLVISLLTGGAFGNWSRKFQQWLFYRRAKKRVAYHNVISYGLILTSTIHMVLFLIEPKYPWSVGFFLGSVSIIGMYMSGFTGMFQRGMVRTMGHEAWRWMHYMSFVFAFAGAAGHVLLDGIHFGELQAAIGWVDPVAPVLEQIIPINNTAPPPAPPA